MCYFSTRYPQCDGHKKTLPADNPQRGQVGCDALTGSRDAIWQDANIEHQLTQALAVFANMLALYLSYKLQ